MVSLLCDSDKPLEGCFLTLTALEDKDFEEARALVAAAGGHLFTGQTTRLVADWQRAYALCPDSLPPDRVLSLRKLADFKPGAAARFLCCSYDLYLLCQHF